MSKNESKFIFKSPDKALHNSVLTAQFCDQPIPSRNTFRKSIKRQIANFNTQPVMRKRNSDICDRKYHVKSGFNIQHKYSSQDKDLSVEKDDNLVKSVFKRRVNSESKASQTKFLINNTNNNTESDQIQTNFAKKIIQDLKRQNLKTKRPNSRYSNKINSKSVQLSEKKLVIRQKLIQNSMQKLKPSFNVNEVKFFSTKKSLSKITSQSKGQVSSRPFNQSAQKISQLKNKPLSQTIKPSKPEDQTFKKMLKKASQPLYSYSQFIKSSGQAKYEIKLQFLNQYLAIKQRQALMVHIDFHSLRLLQSIYSCLGDIFSVFIQSSQNGDKSSKRSFNYDIVREYVGVYFQTYSKIKVQFILCEIMFKNVKKKLTQYFTMQRIVFYWISQLCQEQILTEDLVNLKRIVKFLRESSDLLVTIINMLIEDSKNAKVSQDTIIDTFKSLRLTRELDKKLSILEQALETINLHKSQKFGQSFYNLSGSLWEFLILINKEQNSEISMLFKLEQYFNWNILMIPPLFYLPMNPSKPYSLVIDLDGTLIYYNEQSRILKYRPYMDRFLATMHKDFQIILFSSHPKQRTDIIVKEIQRDDHIFSYRLYKQHMVFQEGLLRKNVGYLGRNLQKVVFVDDQEKNTQWLPSNSFQIKAFTGDKQDKELLNLSDWLIGMIETKPTDVRGKLKKPQSVLEEIVQIDQLSSTIQPSIEYP